MRSRVLSTAAICVLAVMGASAQKTTRPADDEAGPRRLIDVSPAQNNVIPIPNEVIPAKAGIHGGPKVAASVPRLIKFSGTLQDLAGKAIAGPVDVTFSLYAEESGGEPLWFETQTAQADSLGRYTVLLGAMTPAGVPMELFTEGEARWLGVQVTNLPEPARVLLVSVPYALKAADAETLGGKPASAFQLAPICSGDVSSPASSERSSPLKPSREGKKLTSDSNSPAPQVVTANRNYIPMMTDNNGGLGNSMMYQSGAFVGFGTTAPAFGIDLNSNVFAIGPKTPRPGAGGTMRFRDDSGTVRWAFGLPGSAGATDLFFYNMVNGHAPLYIQSGAASYSLYLHANGNLGVGTTSPAARLDVAGGINSSGSLALAGSVALGANLNLPQTTGAGAGVIALGGTPYFHACCGNNDDLFVGRLAGNFAHSGGSNVGVGSFALNALTGGSGNTALGYSALGHDTSGYGNTAVGQAALASVATGLNNTAVGSGALQGSTSSSDTAIGTFALYNNASGSSNAALGAYALFGNTTGSFNTAVGYGAGYAASAGANAAGSSNTFVGFNAAPGTAAPLSNATAIGANAAVSASNAIVLGSINGVNGGTANVRVGIGTATPAAPLHVATGDLYDSQAGSGLIVKSPDGTKCARIGIDNSGALVATPVACP